MHRIDKETSGLMVVAKTDAAHRALSKQFADHGRSGGLERSYDALVWGVPFPPKGTIDAALARSPQNRQKMSVVSQDGKAAVTHYEVKSSATAAAKSTLPRASCASLKLAERIKFACIWPISAIL